MIRARVRLRTQIIERLHRSKASVNDLYLLANLGDRTGGSRRDVERASAVAQSALIGPRRRVHCDLAAFDSISRIQSLKVRFARFAALFQSFTSEDSARILTVIAFFATDGPCHVVATTVKREISRQQARSLHSR